MREVDILILGGGMAGLGAGVEARRLGRESLILEAASAPGGLCRGVTVAGCEFDRYGPKVIIDRPSSAGLVGMLAANAERHELHELTYLSDFGLVGFPVQRYLVDLGPDLSERILAEMCAARQQPKPVHNYRDWLLNSYGQILCEMVLYPYEEKKWQVPLAEMDYHWALDRPVAVDFDEVAKGAQVRLPASRRYFYPRQGNLSGLIDSLAAHAGPIRLDAPVTAIDRAGQTVIASGESYHYRRLISSLPLDQAIRMSTGVPAGLRETANSLLKWLSIRVYNLVFDGVAPLAGDAIYFPEPTVSFRRVAVLRNLCPRLPAPNRTAISLEVVRSESGRSALRPPDVSGIVRELLSVPQFRDLGPLLGSDVVDIAEAYPLQRDGLREYVDALSRDYRQWNIWHCGRAGTFSYCDMDVAYEQGSRAARLAVS